MYTHVNLDTLLEFCPVMLSVEFSIDDSGYTTQDYVHTCTIRIYVHIIVVTSVLLYMCEFFCTYCKSGNIGGDLNLTIWRSWIKPPY